MKLELKKSINTKTVFILAVMFLFLFLLGYFLLVGIDKISNVTYEMLLFSSYTVATQFGFLLFSFVIAYFINREYTNKNILFYKLIGENIYTFFYKKVMILFTESFIFLVISLFIVSLIYQNFSYFGTFLFLFSTVILQYILIIGTISVLSPNILISIGISIVYWITSIILVAIDPNLFGFIAPFEASNAMYSRIDEMMETGSVALNGFDYIYILLYLFSIIIINFILLIFSKKRWVKLGL